MELTSAKPSRVERRRQKQRRLLIPKQLLEETILKYLEVDGLSESVVGDIRAAFSASSILLRPIDGGKSFEVRGLAMQKLRHSTSFLDDGDDEDPDEALTDAGVTLRSLSVAENAFEYQLNNSPAMPRLRPRARSLTTLSTLSYTPRHNYLGDLNIVLCLPAEEGFIRVTLDSGCDVNLMPARMLPTLNVTEDLIQDCLLEIETVKGITEAHQRVLVSFEIHGWPKKYRAWFFILPDEHMLRDGILGHKFLNKHQLYPRDGILPEVMAAQAAASA